MAKIKCLLVTTKDHRRFFTYPENFRQLIEFTKTFGAVMSVVRAESTNLPILDLAELAPAICSPHYSPPNVGEIEILKSVSVEEICNMRLKPLKKSLKRKNRKPNKPKTPRETANEIRQHIRNVFLKSSIVDVRTIANRFRNTRLNLVTFSNHIRFVRDQLTREGKTTTRLGPGQFQLARK